MKNYTYEQLIEKIVRAKVELEGAGKVEHKNNCPTNDDTSYAPCNCGASSRNSSISQAIDHLKL